MLVLSQLSPQAVWSYFEEICKIPRPSKKEEKIRAFLLDFARNHNLDAKHDTIGNVLISIPATKGMEDRATIILQSHMDMVCEKDGDLEFDFNTDPIRPQIDGEWVKATGTTLGADDGIGIAAQMAVLTDSTLAHGPIECLFTVDEETGLSGADALQPGFLKGNILLNLDSEDEGELFIGCAGGIDTIATMQYKRKSVPARAHAYKITVRGLKGGHSGDDINKGLGNSNKILTRLLLQATHIGDIRLAHFDGGNLRNAIPREASALITVPYEVEEAFLQLFEEYSKDVKDELFITEPGLTLIAEKSALPEFVINRSAQRRLLNTLMACPHGVLAMSYRMPGMVETSTNLASVKFIDDDTIMVTTSQRSDLNSAKFMAAMMVESVFTLSEFEVTHSDGYPGWAPNPNSQIMKLTAKVYKELFGNEPIVRSIHAGLECGLFLEKYPEMDMVSFGPTLRGVHSPDEKINIATVDKFWKLLVEVLRQAPKA